MISTFYRAVIKLLNKMRSLALIRKEANRPLLAVEESQRSTAQMGGRFKKENHFTTMYSFKSVYDTRSQ